MINLMFNEKINVLYAIHVYYSMVFTVTVIRKKKTNLLSIFGLHDTLFCVPVNTFLRYCTNLSYCY